MKKLTLSLIVLLLCCTFALVDAWWGGQVRCNGNPSTPAGYAKVTAYGDAYPYDWANAQGWYVISQYSYNGGMVEGTHYQCLYADWTDEEEDDWGGWRYCPVDTYYNYPHHQNQHITITDPPTLYSPD